MIKAIYTGAEFVESAASGYEVGIVLETTSFYAEQGGQVLYSQRYIFYLFVLIFFIDYMRIIL